MEKLSFHLDQFDGPLDLLIHLIQKHKLDIYDIQISQLLEQYMAYMRGWEQEKSGGGQRVFRDGLTAGVYQNGHAPAPPGGGG